MLSSFLPTDPIMTRLNSLKETPSALGRRSRSFNETASFHLGSLHRKGTRRKGNNSGESWQKLLKLRRKVHSSGESWKKSSQFKWGLGEKFTVQVRLEEKFTVQVMAGRKVHSSDDGWKISSQFRWGLEDKFTVQVRTRRKFEVRAGRKVHISNHELARDRSDSSRIIYQISFTDTCCVCLRNSIIKLSEKILDPS